MSQAIECAADPRITIFRSEATDDPLLHSQGRDGEQGGGGGLGGKREATRPLDYQKKALRAAWAALRANKVSKVRKGGEPASDASHITVRRYFGAVEKQT